MDSKETITLSKMAPTSIKEEKPQDMQVLWEHWDQAQKEESPSEYAKGWNLVGVGLFIAGGVFQILGSGWLKLKLAPIIIICGAAILAVKKIKSLWLARSLKN
jgi:hypothetical protein